MKAVILARVSTEEQKEAGNSLPAQLYRLQLYIQRNPKLELVKEFTFDESAYKEDRVKFEEVVEWIEQQKEIVALCCDKVDRLARDFLVGLPKIEKLRREGQIELHFPSDNLVLHKDSPATDLFHFNIAVSLAQYYSNAISDNTRRALEQKLRSGKWIGQPRIGYLNTTKEDSTKDLELDPERAHFVRKIFELYGTGQYSVKTVRDAVHKLGLRSRNGKKLSPSMAHKILKDKFYIGTMTSKSREYPHGYPLLVSRQLFDRVQQILASYKKQPTKYAAKPFALRGLVKCADCGCMVSPELKKNRYILYSCTNYHRVHDKKLYVNEKDLLQPIKEALQSLQLPEDKVREVVDDLRLMNERKTEFHSRVISQLQDEYNKLQATTDRLLDLLVEGSITKDVYDKKLKDYKERQYEIGQQLEDHTKADEAYHITASTVFSLANRALDIFERSEPTEKRQLVGFLLQNCRLSGKKLEFELKSPFDTIASVNEHTPGLPG